VSARGELINPHPVPCHLSGLCYEYIQPHELLLSASSGNNSFGADQLERQVTLPSLNIPACLLKTIFSGVGGEVSFFCVVKENVPVSLRIVIKLLYFHMQLMYLYVT
jgi:hypothetical protein